MVPIPMRIALVSVSSFMGFFFSAMGLHKMVKWWFDGAIASEPLAITFLVVGLVGGVGLAIVSGVLYAQSAEVKVEEVRIAQSAKHEEERHELLRTEDLQQLQQEIASNRQLQAPAAEREIHATIKDVSKSAAAKRI